jgi:hypothetical protein
LFKKTHVKIEKATSPLFIVSNKMKIFIVYDSTGFVWERAHTSFESAVDVVLHYIEQQNRLIVLYGGYEEDRPAKMEKEFTYRDEQGGIMVAHNEVEKFSTFIKALTI